MDISLIMRPMFYHNKEAYCQVEREFKTKLISKHGILKPFVVIDITKNKIYTTEQFVRKFFKDVNPSNEEVIERLDTLRFKVFKKIKLKTRN